MQLNKFPYAFFVNARLVGHGVVLLQIQICQRHPQATTLHRLMHSIADKANQDQRCYAPQAKIMFTYFELNTATMEKVKIKVAGFNVMCILLHYKIFLTCCYN